MQPNLITLLRFPTLLLSLLALHLGGPPARAAGVVLLFLGLMLDTVDGVVARRTGRTSLLGSVLDIAADRTYELVLWVWFATLGMIPVAIPLIVVARTALTDALRSIGVSGGTAPLDQQRTPLGRFLVASTWTRTAYSVGKVATFCGLAAVQALPEAAALLPVLQTLAWATAALCVLRGLPVVSGLRAALADRAGAAAA